jgi:hypothetical protein
MILMLFIISVTVKALCSTPLLGIKNVIRANHMISLITSSTTIRYFNIQSYVQVMVLHLGGSSHKHGD